MEKKSKKVMIIMLIGVSLLFGGIFGFQVFKAQMIKKYVSTMKAPVVTVSAMEVTYQSWLPTAKAAGTLRAVNGVDVTAETNGLVRAIHFQPGAAVKAGDLLVELNADADTAHLHALEAAASLADTTYKRDQAQYRIKAISKAVLDADAADLANKQAQSAEQAAVVAQKTIRAPFDGRLGVSSVNVGQYISAGNKIVTLQALDPIYVDFYLPQQALAYLATDQAVSLTADTYPGRVFNGKITTIDPKVDSVTRNVQVEATVANEDGQLLPGMFASVEVVAGAAQQYLTVPQTAVSFNPYGEIAFVVHTDSKQGEAKPKLTVTQTFVTTANRRGDQVAVTSGLKEGDQIVTSGQLKLKNGSEVSINNTVVPSNNPDPKTSDE